MSQGIALYQEDWDRIEKNLGHREKKIQFIETALLREFERRENPRQKSLTSLTDIGA